MCYPGGIRGFIGDKATETSISPEMKILRDQMIDSVAPIYAAVTCFKDHVETPELKQATTNFSARHESFMKNLIASVEAAGGMSESEKDIVDQEAQRKGCALIGISFANRLTSRYRTGHTENEMFVGHTKKQKNCN